MAFGLAPTQAQALALSDSATVWIAAGTYRGQTEGLRRSRCARSVVVHEALPAELVYALTQALLDHAEECARPTPPRGGNDAGANAVANTFLPFHPGAARYYRESGAGAARAAQLHTSLRTCGCGTKSKRASSQRQLNSYERDLEIASDTTPDIALERRRCGLLMSVKSR